MYGGGAISFLVIRYDRSKFTLDVIPTILTEFSFFLKRLYFAVHVCQKSVMMLKQEKKIF